MPKLTAILLSLLLAPVAAAGGPRLEVALDRDETRVAEPVAYTLRVAGAEGKEIVFPDPADGKIGDFEIYSAAEAEAEDGAREKRYLLQGFDPGSFTLPVPEVTIREAGGEETVLAGPPLAIEVVSVLDPDEENPEIRDLKDPVGLPRSYLWLLYLFLALLAAVGAGYLVYRKFFRRGERTPPPPPPRPAHQVALEELEQIRREDLPGRGLVKEYYSRVSDAVRRYLENRFGLRAPERTTEEFLQEMATTRHLSGDQQDLVAAFLAESDLVKFARYGPSEREIAGVFAAAVRLVEETREDLPGETRPQTEKGAG